MPKINGCAEGFGTIVQLLVGGVLGNDVVTRFDQCQASEEVSPGGPISLQNVGRQKLLIQLGNRRFKIR